jgi:hypothetical protein
MYGKGGEYAELDESQFEDEESFEDVLDRVAADLENVNDSEANGATLAEIINIVEQNYEKDPKEWKTFLDEMRTQVSASLEDGDEEDTAAILEHFRKKANGLTK